MNPAWSRDGKYLLYVSGETGVFNIIAFYLAYWTTCQVTHLLGGAFQPEVSPDGKEILFSSYHATGFRLVTVPYDPAAWIRPRSGASLPVGRREPRANLPRRPPGSRSAAPMYSRPSGSTRK